MTALDPVYGLVRRSECACGDVIIVGVHAVPGMLHETLRRHYMTPRHVDWALRVDYGTPRAVASSVTRDLQPLE